MLQVRAVEVDNLHHWDTTTVVVNVSDVNDHAPAFTEASGVFYVEVRRRGGPPLCHYLNTCESSLLFSLLIIFV